VLQKAILASVFTKVPQILVASLYYLRLTSKTFRLADMLRTQKFKKEEEEEEENFMV
jgi:hypothetical protein